MTDNEINTFDIIDVLNNADGMEHVGIYCGDARGNYLGTVKLSHIINTLNHQKAEIERLEIELKAMRGAANSYKAEIERLQEEGLQINKTFMGFVNKREYEAINRFAERLKEKSQVSIYCDRRLKKTLKTYRITDDVLDDLVNEEMKERF